MFVGNDFLPHLPDLHIHDQALERIFDGYKAVVGDGEDPYLTDETGTIRLPRLQAVFAKLGEWEREVWERERGDVGWLNGKRDVIPVKQGGLTVTPAQRVLFEKIHDFVLSADRHISLVNDFAAGDRKFLGELTADLGLVAEWDAWEGEVNHLVIRKPARTRGVPGAAVEPIAAAVIDEDADEPPESESESESESEEEGQEAIERVLRKYARAAVQPEGTFEEREEGRVNAAMAEWRREYYRDKLGFRDPSEVRDLVKGYVQGLQWVMYYYYRGVPSWGWFYTWHYAPRVGDLTDIASLELTFDLGEPFKPFEQLMGVLPVASGTLVPTCFRELMSSPTSSIRHFYPAEFEQDMNGKKAEWEAVVKIPFIDVNVMRAAMHRVEHLLTEGERKRNSRGTSRVFAVGEGGFYASPLPGFFPALAKDGCVEKEWAPRAGSGWGFGEDSQPKRRTIDNTVMRAGFPSLKTLKHSAVLGVHGVNVHGTESRNRSIVVFIKDEPGGDLKSTLGGRVWVNWPFLREGKVVGVSDEGGRWDHTQLIAGGPSKVLRTPHNPVAWRARGERIEEVYSKKRGVVIGDVSGMLHVRLVVGMERVPETGGLVKRFAIGEVDVPGQMVVRTCPSEEDSRFVERAAVDVKEELGGKRVFFMGEHGYGGVGRVAENSSTMSGQIEVATSVRTSRRLAVSGRQHIV